MLRFATAALVLASIGSAPGRDGLAAGFAPASARSGATSVSMSESSHGGDLVTVRVDVSGARGIYGAAFDVTYDPGSADYVGWAPGTLLEQGHVAPNYTVAPSRTGTVVIGVSRTGSSGVSASGQPVVSLTFRVRGKGAFPVAFRNAVLYDSANPPQPIGGIAWVAGSLTGA
jgi:hypothetical protein